ncbi:MAG: YaaA family protein [Bacteroidota bacterium]
MAVVSPAKTLDFSTEHNHEHTLPKFQKEALQLIDVLKGHSESQIGNLMFISDELPQLNVRRYQKFTEKKDPSHTRHAIFAFQGDAYHGLEADTFTDEELAYAQTNFRILSGLYGLLRPMDLIQPYRLEMRTKRPVGESKNL